MKVVLFGYQTWGHRVLQALIESRHEVVLVVTHPQGEDAYETIWTDSVEELADAEGIPVLVKAAPDDETVARVRDAGADVMVACNWRTWIAPEVFDAPRLGTLNVHDSLLPAYAGFAPLNWALINGEPEVGITAHVMDERLDRGRDHPAAARDRRADRHDRRPLRQDARAVRPDDDRGPRPHGARHRRAPPAGPLAGVVLPQARRRGQSHRLELAGARTSSTSSARRPTRIRTPSASTAARAWRSVRRACRACRPAARRAGSSPARAMA